MKRQPKKCSNSLSSKGIHIFEYSCTFLIYIVVLLMLSFRNILNVDAIRSIFQVAYLVGPLCDGTVLATSRLPGDWRKGSLFHSVFPYFDVIVS